MNKTNILMNLYYEYLLKYFQFQIFEKKEKLINKMPSSLKKDEKLNDLIIKQSISCEELHKKFLWTIRDLIEKENSENSKKYIQIIKSINNTLNINFKEDFDINKVPSFLQRYLNWEYLLNPEITYQEKKQCIGYMIRADIYLQSMKTGKELSYNDLFLITTSIIKNFNENNKETGWQMSYLMQKHIYTVYCKEINFDIKAAKNVNLTTNEIYEFLNKFIIRLPWYAYDLNNKYNWNNYYAWNVDINISYSDKPFSTWTTDDFNNFALAHHYYNEEASINFLKKTLQNNIFLYLLEKYIYNKDFIKEEKINIDINPRIFDKRRLLNDVYGCKKLSIWAGHNIKDEDAINRAKDKLLYYRIYEASLKKKDILNDSIYNLNKSKVLESYMISVFDNELVEPFQLIFENYYPIFLSIGVLLLLVLFNVLPIIAIKKKDKIKNQNFIEQIKKKKK